jgi:hypothetical protein
VYEDCKMTMMRWQLLLPLGRMLLQLAGLLGAAAYADYYSRDLGLPTAAAAAPGGPPGSTATAAPADMFQALQQLLQGQRDGGGAVPLLVQQRAACVQRSVDLLACFSLLADAAASVSASLSLEAAQVGELSWCSVDAFNLCLQRLTTPWFLSNVPSIDWLAPPCLRCLGAGRRPVGGCGPPHCAPTGAPGLDSG